MRDMTPAELDSWYRHHQWPCCGGREYVLGPRGGMAINLTCPKCGMQINVVDPDSHWAKAAPPFFGQVLREATGAEAINFKTGQAVTISDMKGQTISGTVMLASPNGASLMIEFDAGCWMGDGLYTCRIPVLRAPTGVYRDLVNDQPLWIEPRQA